MLKNIWSKYSGLPGGRKALSLVLGKWIPYTGTISPDIVSIESGVARVRLRDRRAVRNHLKSIHAVALMNVAELTSGLATDSRLPPGNRMILVRFEIEYGKKARGTITAEAHCPEIPDGKTSDVPVNVKLTDESGTEVCKAIATWRVGSTPS